MGTFEIAPREAYDEAVWRNSGSGDVPFSTGAAAASDPLTPLDFLIGHWVAPAPADDDAPNRGKTP